MLSDSNHDHVYIGDIDSKTTHQKNLNHVD